MADFNIEIAGQVAAVSSLFESTRDYCRAYLTEKSAHFHITTCREDLVFEQNALLEEAREEGFRVRSFTDPFLERTSIQRKFAEHLLDHDTLLFHGSAVAVDGQGYLFTAKSGTGKSTHTRLWLQAFGSRAVMVNDDKPFLRITPDGVWVYGAPWSGKHGLDTNICVPLRGICLLERGQENRIWQAQPEVLLPVLHRQGYCPSDPHRRARYSQLVDTLAEKTSLWQMQCNKDPQAALVAYEAISAD